MNQIEPTSSVKHDVLTSLTEYVGRVVNITDGEITLEMLHQISLLIPPDKINKWKDVIQIGRHVGILALEDGRIRVRVCDDR